MTDAPPQRPLARLAGWPARHPWPALALALLLAALAWWGIHRLSLNSSIETLLDPSDPSAVAMVQVLHHFPSAENLLVMATVPDRRVRFSGPGYSSTTDVIGSAEADPTKSRLLDYAQRLKSAIESSPEARPLVQSVTYRPDAQTKAFFEKVLVPGGMYYLDDAAFAAAKERLTPAGMAQQIQRNEAMVAAPGPAANALSAALLKDPLRLHEFLLAHFKNQGSFLSAATEGNDGFFSPDGRSLLIRIAGTGSSGNIDFAKKITAVIERLAHEANLGGLEIDLTGAYAIAAASERAIRGDMIASVIGSVICLQLLFILAYRRPFRTFLLAFVPVALGILYGFGIYSIFSRSLSPSTAVLGAILAGLGIDYAVLYLSRYLTTASSEAPARRSAATTLAIGPALVAACITSVIGFLVIWGSHIQALRDFAIVGSLGLGAALITVLWVLPALLALADARGSLAVGRSKQLDSAHGQQVRISAQPLLQAIARHPRKAIALSFLLFLAALAVLFSAKVMLPMESDMTVMHPRPNAPLEAQAKLVQRFGADPASLLVHLHADSPRQLVELAHEVAHRLDTPPVRSAGVAGTFGLSALLPDPRLIASRQAAMTPDQARAIVAEFRRAIADSSFSPEAYEPYAQFLEKLLDRPHAPTLQDLKRYPTLAATLLSRDTLVGQGPPEAITLLSLRHSLNDRAGRVAAVTAVREALTGLPGATLTGLSVIQLDTEAIIARDLPRWLLWAGGLATLYLLGHFWLGGREKTDRGEGRWFFISATVLALLPAIFSLACRLAFMHLADQKLNLMNLIAIPLLIGIDVDYGIFLVSLARQARRDRTSATAAMGASAHAICISAFSTILGFGSLITTSVPAIRSLGWAMSVGVATCLFASLFLLAPILILRARSHARLVPLKQSL